MISNNEKGNKYHDDNNGQFTSGDNGSKNIESKLGGMGFGPGEVDENKKTMNDTDIINKSLGNLIHYFKTSGVSNPVPNSEWADDLYYQLKDDGVSEEEAQRLSKVFADTSEFKHPNEEKINDMGFSPKEMSDEEFNQKIKNTPEYSKGSFEDIISKFIESNPAKYNFLLYPDVDSYKVPLQNKILNVQKALKQNYGLTQRQSDIIIQKMIKDHLGDVE